MQSQHQMFSYVAFVPENTAVYALSLNEGTGVGSPWSHPKMKYWE